MAANQVTVATPGPAGAIGMTYEGLWVDGSVYQVRDCVRFTDNNLYFCNVQHTASSSNTPILDSDKWSLFINADDAFQWATKAKHTQITDSIGNTGYSALHQAAKALDWASLTTDAVTNDANSGDVGYSAKSWAIGGTEVTTTAARGASKEWATKTDAAVDTSEFSSKAYAIGGTGVTTTASKGAAKEWATTTGGAVDTSEFSAKAYAIGGTGVTTSSGKGAAKEWATTTGGAVDTADFSAKAWAIGGTGVTTTSAKGASKEWAIATGLVDTASYSSKEYAQGTAASTGGSAKDYAQYTGGGVRGATSDHSAKAWSVGGTGVTTTSAKGAAKEWATTTGGAVDTSEYSAKEYAIGTTATSSKTYATKVDGAVTGTDFSSKAWAVGGTNVTTTASRGAAKEWATSTGAAVDTSEFSAKEYAIGTTASTGGSSKDYATYVGGGVRGATSDHSAKAWAVGGTGVTTTASKGSAKEWATSTGAAVDTSEYSAKEYATGVTTALGSAKQWALGGGGSFTEGTVVAGGVYSAKKYASDASASATASASSATASASSATASAASETAANASVDAISVIYDAFHDTYLGTMADGATQGTNPTPTGTWAKNSSTITVSAGTNIKVGQVVTGTGMPTSPKPNVISVSGTTVVLSDNMAAAGSGVALTFTGYGIYGTFNVSKDGPALNNDGDALADGMLYFNSTDDVVKVYDETTSAWKQIQPTSAEQTNINTLAAISGNVTTVAGISGNVTTVAGISGNVTTVATNNANVTTVAGSIADVNRYAAEYQIDDFSPSAPTTDGSGASLSDGDLAYDTTANRLKVYEGSAFVSIGLTLAETQTEANNAAVAMSIALG